VSQANWKLNESDAVIPSDPALPDVPDRYYAIPAGPATKLEYRGLPLDNWKDLLVTSPAWRQAKRVSMRKTGIDGRPLTSLHQGHVGAFVYVRNDERLLRAKARIGMLLIGKA